MFQGRFHGLDDCDTDIIVFKNTKKLIMENTGM